MKKYKLHYILLSVLFLISTSLHFVLIPPSNFSSADNNSLPDFIEFEKDVYVRKSTDSLTLKQKIGQLLFISIPANADENTLSAIISDYSPGGIILFASNIQSKSQTQNLTATLTKIAAEHDLPPLFIAVDEEGGVVERIRFDPVPYSAPQLGLQHSETVTKETAIHTTATLHELGINTVFAPVADIAYTSDSLMKSRSFGATPNIVAEEASWCINTFNENDIFSTAKHFPGHGRTAIDSHETLPTISISKETWLETDAIPFISAIDTGVPFIMPGHLLYPSVDSDIASTSSVWLEDILREELGFEGIIVSDDIKMGALGKNVPQTAVDALSAGNDIIIAAVDLNSLQAIQQKILAYYRNSDTEGDLDEKLRRILRLKYEMIVDVEPTKDTVTK